MRRTAELEYRIAELSGALRNLAEQSQGSQIQLVSTLDERLTDQAERTGQSLKQLHERLAVIDASKGPVVLGPGVVVRPFAVLVGPCAILEGSTVAERSLIKASTVIGPHCRAGGEIGGTIFQSYSNKSHDGHLGDSFVGEWVNIGAGTDNSNLLNTYGEVIVRLEPDGGLVKTGRQFWGSILADHVKLAIGTRLMTGTTVGTGAMIAQSRPPASLVPRFGWLVDSTDGAKTFRFDKFMETARAMMSRRGKAPGPAMESALRALHAKATGA